MSAVDPWAVLGLAPGASLADARAARRRLAKQLHPDLHRGQPDLATRMTMVNRALAEIEGSWGKGAAAAPDRPPEAGDRGRVESPPGAGAGRTPAYACGPGDPNSFSVECLPVDAFEALFLAGYGLGDILTADEPYLLELYLDEPVACFCRLTLVPEAGGSLVTAEVSPASESSAPPPAAAVIDVLVAELNALMGC
jgi:hypothetical protein